MSTVLQDIHYVKHPLVQHKMSLLRDKFTTPDQFRQVMYELSLLLFASATQELALQDQIIQTPLEETTGKILANLHPMVVPILRAGLGMLDAFLTLIPTAQIGYIGIKRDEETLKSHCYYIKLPEINTVGPIFVCDPMVATGGTAVQAVSLLRERYTLPIIFICIVAAPEGLTNLRTTHPDIKIYTAALDRQLNDKAYILPGLGDAGDRLHGTH
jgi:uracil phosphoribosyltransferase